MCVVFFIHFQWSFAVAMDITCYHITSTTCRLQSRCPVLAQLVVAKLLFIQRMHKWHHLSCEAHVSPVRYEAHVSPHNSKKQHSRAKRHSPSTRWHLNWEKKWLIIQRLKLKRRYWQQYTHRLHNICITCIYTKYHVNNKITKAMQGCKKMSGEKIHLGKLPFWREQNK